MEGRQKSRGAARRATGCCIRQQWSEAEWQRTEAFGVVVSLLGVEQTVWRGACSLVAAAVQEKMMLCSWLVTGVMQSGLMKMGNKGKTGGEGR